MLTIIDGGCYQHSYGELKITGRPAQLIGDILRNLPEVGGYHIFICQHGFTHQIIYRVSPEGMSGDVVDIDSFQLVN